MSSIKIPAPKLNENAKLTASISKVVFDELNAYLELMRKQNPGVKISMNYIIDYICSEFLKSDKAFQAEKRKVESVQTFGVVPVATTQYDESTPSNASQLGVNTNGAAAQS